MISGVWKTENRPKLASRAQGSSAAKAPSRPAPRRCRGRTASSAEPIRTPSSVPAPRWIARVNTDPKSGLSTIATVSSTQ